MTDHSRERRRNVRRSVASTAVLFLDGIELGRYGVDNLSPGGALLTGEIAAYEGDLVTVLLIVEGRAPIEVDGHVARLDRSIGSTTRMGVAFDHASSATEDVLAELLYGVSALPRRETAGLPLLADLGDPELFPLVPEPI